jgi:diguanylate cyclase (GGDEF)-like protein/PAS domain S-box-containing protein
VSEQLARQTRLHNELLQAMSDLGQGFVIQDGGRLIYANDAMSTMTGLSNAELLALPSHELLFAPTANSFERSKSTSHRNDNRFESILRGAHDRLVNVEVATKTIEHHTIAVVHDVTDRNRSEATLRESEERFRLLVEGVEDYAIYMLDATGAVESWNPGAERVYGWTAAEVMHRPASLFYPEEDVAAGHLEHQLRLATTRGHVEEEGWRVRRDGTRFFASVVVTTLSDDERGARGFAVVARDVTERRAVEAALAYQAMHDDLTRLANRTLFLDRLQLSLARLDRLDTTVAVLFLDIDRFKTINDSLGHSAGDEVLVTAAERLMGVVRPGDTVARFGGDEFVVLCDNVLGTEHAVTVATRLAEVIAVPYELNGEEVCLSASIGIALASNAADEAETLLRDADVALYRAKELGRNRVVVFDDALRARAVVRLETENGLRRAVDRGELCVLYQPEVALRDQRVVGVEALVRWQHPIHGLVKPDQFVPVAEESGLIVPIGNWVIEEACRQSREWALARPDLDPVVVSVNLSARQLSHPGLVAVVARALADTNTPPDRLCLEITESVVMTLRALKDIGVQLAVDDFGTGYSSLSYLKRFPVDILKIDQSFVAGLGGDPEDSAIVAAVTKMGHTLGLAVVAEGVETVTQVEALRRVRCDLAQGQLFAPPLPPERAGELFAQRQLAKEPART